MSANKKLHIAMFPWLAFGHLIPNLELSKLIAKKGHKVSFISTPRNIDRLPVPPTDLIHFVKLPLPHVDELPENAEATIDLPEKKVKYLKLAYDKLQDPLIQFLQESCPDWIFMDFAPYWLPPLASNLKIHTAFFSIFIAGSLGFGGPIDILKGTATEGGRTKAEDFTVPPKWVPFKTTVAFKLFEISAIFDTIVLGDDDNVSDLFRIATVIEKSDVLAVRSCYEFEGEWLKLVEELHRRPVVPVGQLAPAENQAGDAQMDESWREIKKWLDKQKKGSVVYIALGTEAKPSQTQLTEIALGLEQSGFPFLWVLRKKRGESDTDLVELPEGFELRTSDRGFICTSWVPQLKILSHDSVGGFLSHSGWSSVVEAITFGKPLVLLTFGADQGLNARQLEEKKVGYPIPRDERDGSFTRDSVAESLRLVMVEEKGMIYRSKIEQIKPYFCDEAIQDRYIDGLISCLRSYKVKGIN